MRVLKVGAAMLNQTPLDWSGNTRRIRLAVAAARAAQVQVLCLPELAITGYGCEDAFFAPYLQEFAPELLEELLPESKGMAVAVGLPVTLGHALYNAAALLVDGALLGISAKQNLAGDGVQYEPRWFKPWPSKTSTTVRIRGWEVPFGDLLFDLAGTRIGFEICEDAWVGTRAGSTLSAHSVDLILNPSASYFAFGRTHTRERFCAEGSRAFGASYLYANLSGCEAGRIIYDGECLIASRGEIVGRGERFPFSEFALTTAEVDLQAQRVSRAQITSFLPAPPGSIRTVQSPFSLKASADTAPSRCAPRPAWELAPEAKCEEFLRAVTLGLFDYLRKSRSQGFVVSLSGGADSAAVSVLVALMVERGVQLLGPSGFSAALGYVPGIAQLKTVDALTHRLLTCVYQRTRQNSDSTRELAEALAHALHAEFHEWQIDPIVEQYTDLAAKALGNPLSWQQHDTALQNVQARVRSPGVWLLANLKQALLLTTSNRSEGAVGYATMDGDTSGGLNPIGGVDKHFLRNWLGWLATVGPLGSTPMPVLVPIAAQAPSAELRPLATRQTDEGDLMPYALLERIERLFLREKLSPTELYHRLRDELGELHRPQELASWVERFFTLWAHNQWKRERLAPSFHLDEVSVDSKTWCRFPILSGGFEEELRQLKREREAEGKK